MLKVICIKQGTNASDEQGGFLPFGEENVIVGNYYTVVREKEYHDGIYYFLQEIPPTEIFHCDLFAKVSDVDERELVNTKEECV